jgi:calcium-translocating P-type ATPase
MGVHQLSVAEALARLRSTERGLSSSEAARRLQELGPNRLEKITQESLGIRLLREFFGFFSVILWVAAGLAFVGEAFDRGQGMARVGFAIVFVILVSGAFSFWQDYRIDRALAALEKLLPQDVQALRDGACEQVPAERLVPGDVILLEEGSVIPADCRLMEASRLRINDAPLTGESIPRARDPAPSSEDDLQRSKNVLLAGTSVLSGRGKAVVFATGSQTAFGRIARLTQATGKEVSPLRRELAHLSRVIAFLAIAIGVVFFVVGAILGARFWRDVILSIGIIVAMVPEGLLPTLTLALVLAARRMSRRHVLVRHLSSVETLGSATVICADKTGTLTENRMTAREVLLGVDAHVALNAIHPRALVEQRPELFLAALVCHEVREGEHLGKRVLSGDPMEVALLEMAERALPGVSPSPRVDEIPFDERLRHGVVCDTPQGEVLFCKGAPESLLPLCVRTFDGTRTRPLDADARARVVAAQEAMARRGMRVLAFARRDLPGAWSRDALEQDLTFCGLVGLEDPPRAEVPDAVRKCRDAGIKIVMVTGDHPDTATAIAREVGIVRSGDPTVITGAQLASSSDAELLLLLDAPEIVFARVAAEQKLRIVEALKSKHHVVAVTGDGVNDAPALRAAHIGVAMGQGGSDVAREAADVVLLDDNLASLVNGVEEGRATFQNIRKFLTYVLVHNVAELVPYLAYALFPIPLPLTPVQLLAIDMGTDALPALGLGAERPHPAAMRSPPRARDQRLLDTPLALRAYLFLGLIKAAAAMAAFLFVLRNLGWSYGQPLAATDPTYLRATTACMSAIVVMQVVNVFLCRSSVQSVFSTGLLGNRLILWGVLLEVALLLVLVYTPWGNAALGTAPLTLETWLFMLPFAVAMLVLEELRKWWARRGIREPGGSPPPSATPPVHGVSPSTASAG